MQYAVCNLGIVPLRLEPTGTSEMVSQVLYGEPFRILEERAKWSRIRTAFDAFEAWISNDQYWKISEEQFARCEADEPVLSGELVDFINGANQELTPVPLGSVVNTAPLLNHTYNGNTLSGTKGKTNIIPTAFLYLNAPFLWGGKTPFGIDASGFVQMVYKLNGHTLKRHASEQAKQGESLSFIEESEPGDLAFFDNKEGLIDHVGIMMQDNYIIHAEGKVRLDRIDHSGIYNADLKKHTHQLRVIKKII